jgi:hypothetical protein
MTPLLAWMDPAIWACLALAAALLALGSEEARRVVRVVGASVLLVGSLALLATLAVPGLLPPASAVLHRDGSTDDPRVLSALIAAIAALAALLPPWRALRLTVMAGIGVALPGIALGGLVGSLAFFAGLRAPMGLAAVALGALTMGVALVLAFRRSRGPGGLGLSLQGFGVGVLVVAGVLSLHGARATGFTVTEEVPADTLGMHVTLVRVESPRPELRVMTVALGSRHDSLRVRPRLEGEKGKAWQPVADGPLFSGPIVLPMKLRVQRPQAHEVQWLKKLDSLQAGGATIRFTGFRIEHKDSIRMFADLDVTTAAGTERVSPGVIASAKGEIPFSAAARGFGPIAVASFDPDNHRVGLMLPVVSSATPNRHALVLDLRLRPALPFAWAGAALALVGFLLGLAAGGAAGRRT